ncbi:hypothetical protein ELH86_04925 [Rhizobium ruizarguesonis]|nr:hypothetical protein ELH86_04925 [Rhizobium ruizarguesonis]
MSFYPDAGGIAQSITRHATKANGVEAAPHPNPLPVNGARERALREVGRERRRCGISPSARLRGPKEGSRPVARPRLVAAAG